MAGESGTVAERPAIERAGDVAATQRSPLMRAIDVEYHLERWARWRANGCRRVVTDPVVGVAIPSLTGKIIQGMGTGVCPSCKGEGRMPGWKIKSELAFIDPCPQCNGWGRVASGDLGSHYRSRTIPCYDCGGHYKDRQLVRGKGEINGRTCIKCKSAGVREWTFEQVNPASIRTTIYAGANEDSDPISMMIDRTVAGWKTRDETVWFHIVTVIEYAIGGTQEYKAEAAQRHYRRATNYRGTMKISRSWYAKNLAMAHTIIERCVREMLDT